MLLFDFLSHQADVRLLFRVALILEFVNRLPVVRLTNLANVVLQAAVGEHRRRLRRGGRRSRQCARAHCDIRKELCNLERVALLLKKLVIHGRFTGLFSLLLLFTRRKLRLCAL